VSADRVKLVVAERTNLGSAASRRLRKEGRIPGVVYGHSEPVAISVGERDLRSALTTPAGSHAVLDLAIDGGGSHSVILKDYQRDKVRGQIIHVDLQEVRLDEVIHTSVSVALVGDAAGVKLGGVLSQAVNEIAVEALPLAVPQGLEVDVSELGIGESLHLSDIPLPDGVTLLDDPESVLASVVHQMREEVVEEATAEDGAAAGEEPEADGADGDDQASGE
jgi:large subunit ribosomal protein L25